MPGLSHQRGPAEAKGWEELQPRGDGNAPLPLVVARKPPTQQQHQVPCCGAPGPAVWVQLSKQALRD